MIGRLEGYTGDGFKERRAYINNQNDLIRNRLMQQKRNKTELSEGNDKLDNFNSLNNTNTLLQDKKLETNSDLNISSNSNNTTTINSSNSHNFNPLFQSNNYKINNDIK